MNILVYNFYVIIRILFGTDCYHRYFIWLNVWQIFPVAGGGVFYCNFNKEIENYMIT